jgi:hypothetical protein
MTKIFLQNLSLFFAALVLLTTVLRYNGTQYDLRLMNFVENTVEPGLAYLFAFIGFYLWYSVHQRLLNDADAQMFQRFAVGVSILAFVMTVFDSSSGLNFVTGWAAVSRHVASPVTASSFFVLPLILVSPVSLVTKYD